MAGHAVETARAPPLPTQGAAYLSVSELHLSDTKRGGLADMKVIGDLRRR